jgi:hypothetical protein
MEHVETICAGGSAGVGLKQAFHGVKVRVCKIQGELFFGLVRPGGRRRLRLEKELYGSPESRSLFVIR